jgi:hypothetical protein
MIIVRLLIRVKSPARVGSLPRNCARTKTSVRALLSAAFRVAASTSS